MYLFLKPLKLAFAFGLVLFLFSCGDDSGMESTDDDPLEKEEKIIFPELEGLEVINPEKIHNGFVLVNDAGANRVYLMDKTTEIVHEWNLNGQRLGNDAYLLPNGQLLAMLESESPKITFGGFGGIIALMDKDGGLEWSFEYSNENHIAHHDAVRMPNGNILFLSWEKKTIDEALEIGFSGGTEVVYDAVIEVDPTTNEIVWQWHLWDHFIQDLDNSKLNFGTVAENPQLVDINYLEVPNSDGDVSHANGIAYDAENDLIYISANFYSEVWVVDHSTSSEEAKTSAGGNLGKGGNLIYRFGNPSAYNNSEGLRRFDRNHFPNLLQGDKKGNMLIYANGFAEGKSTAYEFKLPENMSLMTNTDNEPEVVWSFTDTNLFSGKVSGVDLLPNGNRLITEGDFGFWEVTESGEVVWRFNTPGFFWRGYHYDKDAPELSNLDL